MTAQAWLTLAGLVIVALGSIVTFVWTAACYKTRLDALQRSFDEFRNEMRTAIRGLQRRYGHGQDQTPGDGR